MKKRVHNISSLALLTMLLLYLSYGVPRAAAETQFPPINVQFNRVPNTLGVNIHFTDPRPGELKMLAAAGFKWVRMDFGWAHTERRPGQYDFSAYDHLLAALEPHGIRAYFILDYANPLYDGGLSPHTEEGRRAFARWAVAAVTHFKGHGILWEMWNEPNIKQFWKPQPNVNDYIALALEVGKALHAATPDEQYVGPASSTMDFKFLEPCLKSGLLEYWSAVSVHPYRDKDPETVIADYAKLRAMIDLYAPKGKRIPIISGEWGFTVEKQRTPEIQGKFLARQFLVNQMCGIPVSIWYDWHDDGTDPKEREHHFGTVANNYHKGRDPVYDPKPAYHASRVLTTALKGFHFEKRLPAGGEENFVLIFSNGQQQRLAAWTTATQFRQAKIYGLKGRFVNITGQDRHKGDLVGASSDHLDLKLTDSPLYLAVEQ